MNRQGCGCGGMRGGCEGENGGMYLQIIIVILLVYVIWRFGSEYYVGAGLGENAGVYTSGANLRIMGQVFSSTNQGYRTTIFNKDRGSQDVARHVIIYPDQSEVDTVSAI